MKTPRITACILFLFVSALSVFPQWERIKFRHLTIENGLTQNTAFSIAQDTTGFMWIGTWAGLNKYDGYTFTVFDSDENDPRCISHCAILTIFRDRSGTIWIGTEKGLNRMDPGSERFTKYFHDSRDSGSISSNWVTSFAQDNAKRLWIGTENGLNQYDPEKKRFIRYRLHSGNPGDTSDADDNNIRSLYHDRRGTLWIGTYGGGLYSFDAATGKFANFRNNPNDRNSLGNNLVLTICQDASGALWIGTDGGGLFRFDRTNGKFVQYVNNPADPHSLSGNVVNVVFVDRSDVLWVGTNNNGLNIFDRTKNRFFSFQYKAEDPASLSNNQIHSIFEDNAGGIWIGTSGGGINLFYRRSQKFDHYKQEPNDSNSLSNNGIRGIYEDRDRVLWIGTTHKGLNRFDRTTNKFTHYLHDPANPHSISQGDVRAICEDSVGVLWIGTLGGGLNKFNLKTMQSTHYRFDAKNPYSISSDKVWYLCEDLAGTIWVGTFEGLNRFDRTTERFTRFYEGTGSFSENWIIAICEDRTGRLWVGTASKGLNKLEPSTGVFTRYTKKNGLPDNSIYGILEDNEGNLWMSTNRGLSEFNPATGQFKNYDVNDGVQSNEFNGASCFKSKSGELFFGGINGFNAFYPSAIRNNPVVPPVVLTDFRIFNKSVPVGKMADGRSILAAAIFETDAITLSHRDDVISFEFAALNYDLPEKNQYAYTMEGLENEWNYSGNRRFVTYSGLSPGRYFFKVKGSNNDGVWNTAGTSLKITITPQVTQTWWFRLCAFLILTGCVIFLVKFRMTLVRQRLEKQKIENELRIKANFTAMLVHDLRNPLSCISGYSQLLKMDIQGTHDTKPCDVITGSADKMVGIINDMLDIYKFEAGKMTVKKEPAVLRDIFNTTLELMVPLLRDSGVSIRKNIAVDAPLQADATKIERVINNLIANAIKFSPKNGVVTVALSQVKTHGAVYQEFSVADEGTGIDPVKQNLLFNAFAQIENKQGILPKGTGLGLAVSRLIIEAHGGTIGFRPGEEKGSVFYFRLPEG